jgi:hypothetical protein
VADPPSEDRFGDLGPSPQRGEEDRPPRRSAAQRLAELDERDAAAERARPAGPPPRPRGRYMWVVGVVFFIVLAVAGLNALRHSGGALRGPAVGQQLPAFAAPLATGHLQGDANVKQLPGQSNQLGAVPACQVHLPGSITSCELARKPLVLSVIVPGASRCEAQLDLFERILPRYPRAQFAAIVSGAKLGTVASLVRKHGWTFPVAVDHDLSVFNLYRVAVCPTTIFARPGGRVERTSIHPLDESQVAAGLRAVGGA